MRSALLLLVVLFVSSPMVLAKGGSTTDRQGETSNITTAVGCADEVLASNGGDSICVLADGTVGVATRGFITPPIEPGELIYAIGNAAQWGISGGTIIIQTIRGGILTYPFESEIAAQLLQTAGPPIVGQIGPGGTVFVPPAAAAGGGITVSGGVMAGTVIVGTVIIVTEVGMIVYYKYAQSSAEAEYLQMGGTQQEIDQNNAAAGESNTYWYWFKQTYNPMNYF